jgi:hypothetical protein
MKDIFDLVRTTYDPNEQSLAFIRFKNHWLNHSFPSEVLDVWDVQKWVMVEGRRLLIGWDQKFSKL